MKAENSLRCEELRQDFHKCVAYQLKCNNKAVDETAIDRLFNSIVKIKNPFSPDSKWAKRLEEDKHYLPSELKTVGMVQAKSSPGKMKQQRKQHLEERIDYLKNISKIPFENVAGVVCIEVESNIHQWKKSNFIDAIRKELQIKNRPHDDVYVFNVAKTTWDWLESKRQKERDNEIATAKKERRVLRVPTTINAGQPDWLKDAIMRCLVNGLKELGIAPYEQMLVKGTGQNCPYGLAALAFEIHGLNIAETNKSNSPNSYVHRWLQQYKQRNSNGVTEKAPSCININF